MAHRDRPRLAEVPAGRDDGRAWGVAADDIGGGAGGGSTSTPGYAAARGLHGPRWARRSPSPGADDRARASLVVGLGPSRRVSVRPGAPGRRPRWPGPAVATGSSRCACSTRWPSRRGARPRRRRWPRASCSAAYRFATYKSEPEPVPARAGRGGRRRRRAAGATRSSSGPASPTGVGSGPRPGQHPRRRPHAREAGRRRRPRSPTREGLEVSVLDDEGDRRGRPRWSARREPGLDPAGRASSSWPTSRPVAPRLAGAGRQGHHLRLGRPVAQDRGRA